MVSDPFRRVVNPVKTRLGAEQRSTEVGESPQAGEQAAERKGRGHRDPQNGRQARKGV